MLYQNAENQNIELWTIESLAIYLGCTIVDVYWRGREQCWRNKNLTANVVDVSQEMDAHIIIKGKEWQTITGRNLYVEHRLALRNVFNHFQHKNLLVFLSDQVTDYLKL